jgi:hypothetical protein
MKPRPQGASLPTFAASLRGQSWRGAGQPVPRTLSVEPPARALPNSAVTTNPYPQKSGFSVRGTSASLWS